MPKLFTLSVTYILFKKNIYILYSVYFKRVPQWFSTVVYHLASHDTITNENDILLFYHLLTCSNILNRTIPFPIC